MVRVLSLGDDSPDDHARSGDSRLKPGDEIAGPDPNIDNGFSMALGCYPIVTQLASSLDLTSLSDLSRVCRRFRSNLLSHRRQLIALSLRCKNENVDIGKQLSNAFTASFHSWNNGRTPRYTSGRIGACARDLVGECRRCSQVVCRNCIMKPPPPQTLKGRHRRLCRACIKADMSDLSCYGRLPDDGASIDEGSGTAMRSPCTCTAHVWICSACGAGAKSDDTTYMRGWSWRTRYSTCGGFGAGLGEGVEGVECGRGVHCLAAAAIEKEVECDADELAVIEAEVQEARLKGRAWAGNSYTTHEMVGIGGQVKVKVKKMVIVGATVQEHEDERTDGHYLRLEQDGTDRSWCSWCDRVIPSESDRQTALK